MSNLMRSSVAGIAVCFLLGFGGNTASAGTAYEKIYRVEVEYWYWPPDIYYWGNYLETTDEFTARFAQKALELARDGGYLSSVVDSSNTHIPVDVKLTVTFRPKVHFHFGNPNLITKPVPRGEPFRIRE